MLTVTVGYRARCGAADKHHPCSQRHECTYVALYLTITVYSFSTLQKHRTRTHIDVLLDWNSRFIGIGTPGKSKQFECCSV